MVYNHFTGFLSLATSLLPNQPVVTLMLIFITIMIIIIIIIIIIILMNI